MTLMRSVRCAAKSRRTDARCRLQAVVGAKVCHKHGASAPQVRAAAARRVTLAEALASTERRHPQEVLASALHQVDVMAEHVLDEMKAGRVQTTPELVSIAVDSNRARAGMAKLVLETGGEAWSAQEAYRQQGDALARICRVMAWHLGFDPGEERVVAAFESAVAEVVHGTRRGRRPVVAALGRGSAGAGPSGQLPVDAEVVA